MAEVGLVLFVRVALQVASAVLTPYRSCFSKHQFAQAKLLAVLCLMRQLSLQERASFQETRWLLLKNPWNLNQNPKEQLSTLVRWNSPLVRAWYLKGSLPTVLDLPEALARRATPPQMDGFGNAI